MKLRQIRPLIRVGSGKYRSSDGEFDLVRDPLIRGAWNLYWADGDTAITSGFSLRQIVREAERTAA